MNTLLSMLSRMHFTNGEIDLRLSSEDVYNEEYGIQDGYVFYIYKHHGLHKMGYVSLRLGESPSLYYLGHIGYRIDPLYRGYGYARQACELLRPLLREHGLRTVVITTDPDNTASRRTCEHLGCVLESIADVPQEYRVLCSGSEQKCRYIFFSREDHNDR